MTEIATTKKSSNSHPILEIFPLGLFSDKLMSDFKQSKDDRFLMTIRCSFEMAQLKAMYGVLQQQIPGLGIAFPLSFVPLEDNSYAVIWIGDHDPFNLCDMTIFHATSFWIPKGKDGHEGVTIRATWETPAMTGCNCAYSQSLIKLITRCVTPEIFNESFLGFFAAMKIQTYCPSRDEEGYRHPYLCSMCNNEGVMLLHKTFNPRFNPASWFELVSNTYGWAKPK